MYKIISVNINNILLILFPIYFEKKTLKIIILLKNKKNNESFIRYNRELYTIFHSHCKSL